MGGFGPSFYLLLALILIHLHCILFSFFRIPLELAKAAEITPPKPTRGEEGN